MKIKKSILLMVILACCLFYACSNNDDLIAGRSYIRMSASSLADTVYIDSVTNIATINVSLQCSVENGCWNNMAFLQEKVNDSTYAYAATGIFEDLGQFCAMVIQVVDTGFVVSFNCDTTLLADDTIPPYYTSKMFFDFYSLGYLQRADTVVIASYRLMPKDTLQ